MDRSLYLIAYDGHDRHVVDFGVDMARIANAQIAVVHILHWSPYTFLTNEELAARHKVRESEIQRAKTMVLDPLIKDLAERGVTADAIVRHGQTVDVLIQVGKERNATLLFVGRSSSMSRRMFGSVTSALAQESPMPVVIVP